MVDATDPEEPSRIGRPPISGARAITSCAMVPPIRQTEQRRAAPVLAAFGDYDAMRLRQFASVHGGARVEKWQLFGAASSFGVAAE